MNETKVSNEHSLLVQEATRAVEARAVEVREEQFRLHYHVMPPANWMNDPNGLIQYKGEYHLFYQHYPYGDKWGPMHWGHAKSKDLVHWEHLPVALAPSEPYDKGGEDGFGCWSGSAIEDQGKLVLFYTGHVDSNDPKEVQCMAVSEDGIVFEKFTDNPVIPGPPDGACFGFRDPKVWKHQDLFYMVIGSGKDGKGRALLYRSADLTSWEYVGVAAESDGTQGDMWECPDLFPLGNKHVLIISPMNMEGVKNLYMVGEMDYEKGVFTAEYQAKLDDGFDFYAGQTLLDDKGRRIIIAWFDMWGSKLISENRGWYGAMTLPRELLLASDGTLTSRPVPELESLREQETEYRDIYLRPNVRTVLKDTGGSMEILAEIDLTNFSADELTIKLRSKDGGQEETVIGYRPKGKELYVDRSSSGIGDGGRSRTELPHGQEVRLSLRIYADRSSVEVFVNGGQRVLSNRVYPLLPFDRIEVESAGGDVRIPSMTVWKLKSIWSDGNA